MSNIFGSVVFVEETCCVCFTHFAMDSAMNAERRATGGLFYCPNGHGQSYTDTEVARLRRQNQSLENRTRWAERDAETARRSRAAIKGQLTKTRNRIANGVCPCCHRTFKQLMAHMNNKHPEFVETVR